MVQRAFNIKMKKVKMIAKTEEILKKYRDDISNDFNKENEFPITRMSSAVAYVIANLSMNSNWKNAIDMGTGSGIHSSILALCGCTDIRSVDINELAINAADSRFDRMFTDTNMRKPIFEVSNINNFLLGDSQQFDVVVTNPPSYFQPSEIIIEPATPLETGLFDINVGNKVSVTESYLYHFFNCLVKDHLAPGGTVICTWPALQRQLVNDDDGSIIHPVDLLITWFGWDIEGRQEQAGNDFFKTRIPLFYPGLGNKIIDIIKNDIDADKVYSNLVFAGNALSNYCPTYPFGVLVLVKDKKIENKYWYVDIDPQEYEREKE